MSDAGNGGPTHGGMTKRDYERLRQADEDRIRDQLAQESEKDRQKRLYIEENRRRRGELG